MGNTTKTFSVCILQFLILLQSISAVIGGGALLITPSGKLIDMPLSLLHYSPFSDFLIPGLFLCFVLGIIPLVSLYGLINKSHFSFAEKIFLHRKYHWSLALSYYIGIVLILWIDIEVMFIRGVDILHFVYSVLGVLIIYFSNLPSVVQFYKKPE
jgi:hypothetical protein